MKSSSVRLSKADFRTRLAVSLRVHNYRYLLILPGFLFLLIFNYYPLYFLQAAFKDYNIIRGLDGSAWVGFENFIRLFQDSYFLKVIRNTVILSAVMYRILAFPVPIILALLLNELLLRPFKRTIQTLIYIPHFISWVIIAGIWITVLSPDGGLINVILGLFGIEEIYFLAKPSMFRWILLLQYIWQSSGWGTIIYLAAISGIDPALYEAAIIDGANRFQRILYVTLPSIAITIIVIFILSMAKILNLFEQVFVMLNPVVAPVGQTIDTYVYEIGIRQGRIDLATAVGLFKNIISLVLILLANRFSKILTGEKVI